MLIDCGAADRRVSARCGGEISALGATRCWIRSAAALAAFEPSVAAPQARLRRADSASGAVGRRRDLADLEDQRRCCPAGFRSQLRLALLPCRSATLSTGPSAGGSVSPACDRACRRRSAGAVVVSVSSSRATSPRLRPPVELFLDMGGHVGKSRATLLGESSATISPRACSSVRRGALVDLVDPQHVPAEAAAGRGRNGAVVARRRRPAATAAEALKR